MHKVSARLQHSTAMLQCHVAGTPIHNATTAIPCYVALYCISIAPCRMAWYRIVQVSWLSHTSYKICTASRTFHRRLTIKQLIHHISYIMCVYLSLSLYIYMYTLYVQMIYTYHLYIHGEREREREREREMHQFGSPGADLAGDPRGLHPLAPAGASGRARLYAVRLDQLFKHIIIIIVGSIIITIISITIISITIIKLLVLLILLLFIQFFFFFLILLIHPLAPAGASGRAADVPDSSRHRLDGYLGLPATTDRILTTTRKGNNFGRNIVSVFLGQRVPSLFLASSFGMCLNCEVLKFLKVCFPGGLGSHQARYPLSRCRYERARIVVFGSHGFSAAAAASAASAGQKGIIII